MAARVTWSGLDELRAQLRKLPADLSDEASGIVLDAANQTVDVVGAVYDAHAKTGNLRSGLFVRVSAAGPYGTGAIVKSNAKHAWLFDHGSQLRHYVTKGGKTHSTGQMWGKTPPTHVFVRTVVQQRHAMYGRLKALLVKHGATVSGDA